MRNAHFEWGGGYTCWKRPIGQFPIYAMLVSKKTRKRFQN